MNINIGVAISFRITIKENLSSSSTQRSGGWHHVCCVTFGTNRFFAFCNVYGIHKFVMTIRVFIS